MTPKGIQKRIIPLRVAMRAPGFVFLITSKPNLIEVVWLSEVLNAS